MVRASELREAAVRYRVVGEGERMEEGCRVGLWLADDFAGVAV